MLKFIASLQLIHTILYRYNRRAELKRLVAWAKKKRLANPLRLYTNSLIEEEIRLNRYTVQYPSHTRWARRIHILNEILFPAPRYHPRGSASHYKNLQTLKKTYSI